MTNLLKYMQCYHQLSLINRTTGFEENYFYNLPSMNQEQGMLETFAVRYQETEGAQTLLQVITLFLEAGQTQLVETLVKKLPISPMKSYQVKTMIFRWVCFMKPKVRQKEPSQVTKLFSANYHTTHPLSLTSRFLSKI